MPDQVDRLRVITRWECPICGPLRAGEPSTRPDYPAGTHVGCAGLAVLVEYVPKRDDRGAVDALREIDHACTLGAERLGMSPDGVTALRRIARRGIGGQSETPPAVDEQRVPTEGE